MVGVTEEPADDAGLSRCRGSEHPAHEAGSEHLGLELQQPVAEPDHPQDDLEVAARRQDGAGSRSGTHG